MQILLGSNRLYSSGSKLEEKTNTALATYTQRPQKAARAVFFPLFFLRVMRLYWSFSSVFWCHTLHYECVCRLNWEIWYSQAWICRCWSLHLKITSINLLQTQNIHNMAANSRAVISGKEDPQNWTEIFCERLTGLFVPVLCLKLSFTYHRTLCSLKGINSGYRKTGIIMYLPNSNFTFSKTNLKKHEA